MNADFFVDSNVALYALDNATLKNSIATDLIRKRPVISAQVVLESVNICIKKFKFSKEVAYEHGINLIKTCSLTVIQESTLLLAFKISIQYLQRSPMDNIPIGIV